MNKKLYITLLEEEVVRLREENHKLRYDLNAAKEDPMQKIIREMAAEVNRDMFAGVEAVTRDYPINYTAVGGEAAYGLDAITKIPAPLTPRTMCSCGCGMLYSQDCKIPVDPGGIG